jgi:hypothetical protein
MIQSIMMRTFFCSACTGPEIVRHSTSGASQPNRLFRNMILPPSIQLKKYYAPLQIGSTVQETPPMPRPRAPPHVDSPIVLRASTPAPSPACATISTIAHLLPLQIAGPTPQGTNHQCHRTTLPRSPTTDQAMGIFQDKTSMDRILSGVFTHENKSQGVRPPSSPDTESITSPMHGNCLTLERFADIIIDT